MFGKIQNKIFQKTSKWFLFCHSKLNPLQQLPFKGGGGGRCTRLSWKKIKISTFYILHVQHNKNWKVRHQRQIKFEIENPNILQHPTFWLTSYFAPLLNLFPNHKGKRLKLDKNMLRIFFNKILAILNCLI